jgi:hypothetical protein
MRSTSQPILSHLPASFRRLRVHRLRGSPPEPVSSEQHSVGFLRRGSLRCAAASLVVAHPALRTYVGVPFSWLARACRNPSARAPPATIVWPPSSPSRASLSCLVGLTEPLARLGESPNMPSCSLCQVCRARFRRCGLPRTLSSGVARTRACPTCATQANPKRQVKGATRNPPVIRRNSARSTW